MVTRKLLYATNLTISTFDVLRKLLDTHGLRIEEVIVLSNTCLETLAKDLSSYDIKSKFFLEEAPLVPKILSTAKAEGVSLIVAHLERKPRGLLRSSAVRNLIKNTSVPALIINQGTKDNGGEKGKIFRHVVFATDWSPESERALVFLLELKGIINELEIVNVINKKLTVRDMRKLKERLAETRKVCLNQGIDAEFHIYAGEIAEEIITAATDYKATAIILGTRRKPHLSEFFSANTSYRVAENAPIPTLVVPRS